MDFQKQAQDYYCKAPLIVLGSGASAKHGMPGMGALASHLIAKTDTSNLSTVELSAWPTLCQILENGVDLETALHQVVVSQALTRRIIQSTWELINSEDVKIFQQSLLNKDMFPLGTLLEHMFKSSLTRINIVTTNYDRLAEYACEQKRLHHYTGFTHGFFRQLASPNELTCSRRVNIWKVHGSLDWFQSPIGETIALSHGVDVPDSYESQIITPGTQKYQRTHLEPYRSIINNADQAITAANSYLCVGYGFNDEHIQPKLIAKCFRQNTPITIITHSLSDATKRLIVNGEIKNYLAIERGITDDQSIVYSSTKEDSITIDKNIWSFDGYLSLIM